jgi:hypothetical protein
MIEQKAKICKGCGKLRKLWARGKCLTCSKREKSQNANTHERQNVKRKPIRRISDKQAERNRQYSKDRREFLSRAENQNCRVFKEKKATEVHHRKGRLGRFLLEQQWWLPVSREGHQWIESNPDAAREKGFILTRI